MKINKIFKKDIILSAIISYVALALIFAFCLKNAHELTLIAMFAQEWYLFIILLLLVIAAFLFYTKKINSTLIKTINQVNFDNMEEFPLKEEFAPLLDRIDKEKKETQQNNLLLEQRKQEFKTVTRNLQEGLVILDNDKNIEYMNESAGKIFNVSRKEYYGRSLFEVSSHNSIKKALENAIQGKHIEELFYYHAKYYKLFSNPIRDKGNMTGLVLLMWDVTETRTAEQARMEFSANVSHELKTPLTSISGYAEIMKEGIAKPEDVAIFSSKIYEEATRLVRLINDIIKLSKLDETEELETEKVNLKEIISEVCSRYKKYADEKKIEMIIVGQPQYVLGIYGLLDDLIKNLVENALKYNKQNGKVTISLYTKHNSVFLNVTDTGMGIPFKYQERVFERFFRVDKSHSKETGGTGLGLSIVKHVANLHNAKIDLTSKIGEGTSISIIFPEIEEKLLDKSLD